MGDVSSMAQNESLSPQNALSSVTNMVPRGRPAGTRYGDARRHRPKRRSV